MVGLVIGLIWGAVAVFGLTAVAGLVWAVQHGQMERFAEGARSIFDDEEPVGEATDATLRRPRQSDPEMGPEHKEGA